MNSKSSSVSRLRNSGLQRSLTTATVVGGASASVMTANAAVIYSGPKNLSTSSLVGVPFAEDTESVNIDDAGVDEFRLYSFGTKGSDFHWLVDHNSEFGVILSPDSFYVGNLPYGQLISNADAFGAGSSLIDNQTDFFPPESVPWNSGSEGYIGFRFNPSGSHELYGWGHVTISADRTVMTLVDWAYEDAGAPIHAGEIPEPTTSLLLTGSLAAAAIWRRLRKPLRS